MAKWGPLHDDFLQLMKEDAPREKLELAVKALTDCNAFHTWRDATFNLLFHAVIENRESAFELLLKHGAEPTLVNDRGTSVLHLLMKRNLDHWADLCIKNMDAGGKIDFANSSQRNGWTALMAAAENNHPAACKWLLIHGAEVNNSMTTGWTASHAAAKKGYADVLELLLKWGADPSIEAMHRDFGKGLKVADVTSDAKILKVLQRYK